uniref:PGRP domain-containing protein n=1 Tax=Angiostrongylus cantonensis TaxID=6313 RepID=A0A0K0CUP9_ANGCA
MLIDDISDHERYEFSCERRGWAQFSGGVDRMFYTIVGETSLIMIGIRAIAIAPLQPPTLVECALMALQDQYCNKYDVGARMGGLSPEDIKKMVGYRGTSLIPT